MARARAGSEGEAVIGPSTRVRGRVNGDGDLRIEGTVHGDITLRGTLTVAGELEGEVRADGVVRLESGAKVRGDIHGESVAIDDGAEYVGNLDAQFELPPELGGASAVKRR